MGEGFVEAGGVQAGGEEGASGSEDGGVGGKGEGAGVEEGVGWGGEDCETFWTGGLVSAIAWLI